MRAARMNTFGAFFERLFERRERGSRAPGHRKRRKVEITHRLPVADHQRHGLAAKAGDAHREHRLVRERRDNAIAGGGGGERTTPPTSPSAGHSSAPKISAPESLRTPSRRGTRRPTAAPTCDSVA